MNKCLRFDVLIVGGGLVGSTAALALARRGLRVGLFERGLCGAQASGVNYGGLRRQGRPIEQLPLAMRARSIWERLPGLIGTDAEFVVSGHLRLARSEADIVALETYAAMVSEYGLELRIVAGASFRHRFPYLGPTVIGGSLCVEDGHANPRLVSPAFARAARAAGANVYEQTPVTDAIHDGERFIIHADGIEAQTEWLINAAGAWSNQVAGYFGDTVSMESIYPNMWVTEPLPHFIDHSLGVYGGGLYARQVARGNCIIGGGRGHGDGQFGRPFSQTTRSVMHEACLLLPNLKNALLIRSWSGVEGCTPDGNPIIGPSPTVPRLLHAFGFSGAGFLVAPAVGEILAELVIDGTTSTPIDAFKVNRFVTQRKGAMQ